MCFRTRVVFDCGHLYENALADWHYCDRRHAVGHRYDTRQYHVPMCGRCRMEQDRQAKLATEAQAAAADRRKRDSARSLEEARLRAEAVHRQEEDERAAELAAARAADRARRAMQAARETQLAQLRAQRAELEAQRAERAEQRRQETRFWQQQQRQSEQWLRLEEERRELWQRQQEELRFQEQRQEELRFHQHRPRRRNTVDGGHVHVHLVRHGSYRDLDDRLLVRF